MDIVKHGLNDENQKVKTITALTVSALAEAASPYGIESFDDVLEPLWKGIRLLRGKVSYPPMHCPDLLCLQHSVASGTRVLPVGVRGSWPAPFALIHQVPATCLSCDALPERHAKRRHALQMYASVGCCISRSKSCWH